MKMLWWFMLGLALASALPGAETPRTCAGCQRPLSGTFYWATSPALAEKQPVCETCRSLKSTCALCQLPVPNRAHLLDEKRVLCERDFQAGIFDEREAQRIFEEAKGEAQRLLDGYGTLPDQNITASLVSGKRLNQLYQSLPSVHESSLMGLTKTEVTGGGRQFRHSIYLLNGLGRARLAAVAAHEFTHTWMHENIPANRKLEKDTIEGFCELVAYKVMTSRKEEQEKKVILANAYTRGQVAAFVQAENQHQFKRVIQWLKTGVDEELVEGRGGQVLDTREEPSAPLWPPPARVNTTVPETLVLKGISGTASRRFALINDTTMTKNEEARVRVGTSNVMLRCLEIRPRSVVVQLRGGASPMELILGAAD